MKTIDFVTAATAGVGAVLGLVNTFWALQRDRVRVRVRPVWMINRVTVGGVHRGGITSEAPSAVGRQPDGWLGIRVTNLGLVEVTIDGVGVTPSNWFARLSPDRVTRKALFGDAFNAAHLPAKLGPRQTVTLWGEPRGDDLRALMHDVTRVYATTACGMNVFGTSGLLRRLVKHARGR